VFEEEFQRMLGSARSCLALRGDLIKDPLNWEQSLSEAVADAAPYQLALEATRIPRPPSLPSAKDIESKLEIIFRNSPHETADEIESTLNYSDAEQSCKKVDHLDLQGWAVVASIERSIIDSDRWRGEKGRIIQAVGAIELRIPGDSRFLDFPPITKQSYRSWFSTAGSGHSSLSANQTAPLFGIDPETDPLSTAMTGLGWSCQVISPLQTLTHYLQLTPSSRLFELKDSIGPALLLRHWRTRYTNDSYSLTKPTVVGAQILIRPDLLKQLLSGTNYTLIWRKYGARQYLG
jgi:hypothetical protein